MAIYNEILSARFSRLVQRLFSMKGMQAVKQVSGEISTTLNLFSGVENRYLEGWNRFATAPNAAAAAANTGGIRVRNPVGSNVVIVLERIEVSENANDNIAFRWGQATSDLATVLVLTGTRLDGRTATTIGPTAIVSTQNTAPTVPTLTNQFTIAGPALLANTAYQYIWNENQEIAILPGDAFQIEAGTVNQLIKSSLLWRERLLEESERTP